MTDHGDTTQHDDVPQHDDLAEHCELHPSAVVPSSGPVVLLHGGTAAGWMWQEQLEVLRDRTVLTLDLPGFGHRATESWPGLDTAADDVVARVRRLGVTERFHLVGLSLGAVTALHVLARHPDAVLSTFATGAILAPMGRPARALARAQLALWDARCFWQLQARMYGLDEEGRSLFVAHGLTLRRENMVALMQEVYGGGVPQGLGPGSGRILAIAAEHDPAPIHRSLALLGAVAPQAELRVAPGMHHIWSIEDVDLFNQALLSWLRGEVEPRLLPA